MALPTRLTDALGAMQQVTQAIDASSGAFNYLKLQKSGDWVFGSDDSEPNPDSVFAVDTESFFTGFQAWDDGELLGEEIRLITEPQIRKGELKDVGANWQPMLGFKLLCVEGPDKGLQLIYKTISKGGIKAVNNLMKEILNRLNGGKHKDAMIPLIQLTVDSYKHNKYGKIYTPVFLVVDWVVDLPEQPKEAAPADKKAVAGKRSPAKIEDYDADDEDDADDDEDDAEPEPEPAPRRRRRV